MKAVLEFNLPDDKDDYTMANAAGDMYCVLWDIEQYIRTKLKHGDPTPDQTEILNEIRVLLQEFPYKLEVS